jgi:mannose-6-phosphate isomerase-like protein (cupin superfamily)
MSLGRLNDAIRACARGLLAEADASAAVALDHLLACTGEPRLAAHRARAANPAAERHLPPILGAPGPWPAITAALGPVWRDLDWHYHYAERDDAPGLGADIAFAELIGPGAPLSAAGIRAGFTLIGPHVLYPAHAHPAHELYVVLSGRALWTRSGRSAWRDPGAVIVHDSEETHAMQTGAETLLALYSWRGAIDAPSRYV